MMRWTKRDPSAARPDAAPEFGSALIGLVLRKLIFEPLILFAYLCVLDLKVLKLRLGLRVLRLKMAYLSFSFRYLSFKNRRKLNLGENVRYRKFHRVNGEWVCVATSNDPKLSDGGGLARRLPVVVRWWRSFAAAVTGRSRSLQRMVRRFRSIGERL